MNKENQPVTRGLFNTLTLLSSAISILLIVVYGTWFMGMLEKRISVLEKETAMIQRLMVETNTTQEKAQARFQESIDKQLSRLENRIEKIYTLVSKDS